MIAPTEVKEAIRAVATEIDDAEANLATVIAALEALPRAEKVRVSEVVQAAFVRLRTAQARLGELERQLAEGEAG